MTEPGLTVAGQVITEVVRLAALEVRGVRRVGRAGPFWRRAFLGRPVVARVRDGRAAVRLALVARPGEPLHALTSQVRAAVGATIERQLGLELEGVTVVIDGISS